MFIDRGQEVLVQSIKHKYGQLFSKSNSSMSDILNSIYSGRPVFEANRVNRLHQLIMRRTTTVGQSAPKVL